MENFVTLPQLEYTQYKLKCFAHVTHLSHSYTLIYKFKMVLMLLQVDFVDWHLDGGKVNWLELWKIECS